MKSFKKNFKKYTSSIFAVVVILILYAGWRLRSHELITPESGLGYVFGIVGFSLIVILMIYPLRKRLRFLGKMGEVKTWFKIHMFLGIIGPVFILFHCNFQLGSFNSNVALLSMVVVSISGIFGRFIYSRIHHGLYGQRANLVEIRSDLDDQRREAEFQLRLIPGVLETLLKFSDQELVPPKTLKESLRRVFFLKWTVLNIRQSIKRISNTYLNQYAQEHHWSAIRKRKMNWQVMRKTNTIIKQTLKVSQFGFYERLFVLWHIFHIPLVYMLFLAAIIHIIAVHLY